MTARFCGEVLRQRKPAVALMWLTDPDHTLHGTVLGSPTHLAALRGADSCVGTVLDTVEALRRAGDEVLLMAGSDHGQETIGDFIDLDDWLSRHGLAAEIAAGTVAVAGQGTSALLYATPAARSGLLGVLGRMRAEPWSDGVLVGEELDALGFAASGGVVAAVNMARRDEANEYGVPGRRWVVAEGGKRPTIGWGQHGGWGPDETRPFLLLNVPQRAPGRIDRRTALVDIAPTLLDFVGLPTNGMDGRSLL
jgi:arylsulfatase A-like enzyme